MEIIVHGINFTMSQLQFHNQDIRTHLNGNDNIPKHPLIRIESISNLIMESYASIGQFTQHFCMVLKFSRGNLLTEKMAQLLKCFLHTCIPSTHITAGPSCVQLEPSTMLTQHESSLDNPSLAIREVWVL